MVPSEKRAPVLGVRTAPVDGSADGAMGPARTSNGLDTRSFFAWSPEEIRDVA